MDIETLKGLRADLDTFLSEFDLCFRSDEARTHLGTYVRGQLGPLPRKSLEPIALEAGVPPRSLQQFLGLLSWDAEAFARTMRKLVARDHADADAIGVIDGTDYVKQGKKTVGVQPQYCGEMGKVQNCVATVHLDYVNRTGFHTLVDSDIYLPESWTSDAERRAAAGIPSDLEHRTKWRIALSLIARTMADGVPLRWITADEDFGRVSGFLDAVALMGLYYVVEIPKSVEGWTAHRKRAGRRPTRVDNMWRRGGPSWATYHVKDTGKGPVVWNARANRFVVNADEQRREQWLVVAENVLTGETKYFLSNAPKETTTATLLTVAFSRWNVERSFEDAKQEVGLGHFEVRSYKAVQRHLAVSMASLLFLKRAASAARRGGKGAQLEPRPGQGRSRSSA